MNKSIFNTAVAVAAVFCIGCGGNSTGGSGDNTEPVKTHAVNNTKSVEQPTVDSSIAKSEVTAPEITTFTDDRDGKTYKKVTIGTQTWMAENLNIVADSSVCYNNDESNCEQYGRLYTWGAAMRACPVGWRLPTDEEWTTLVDYAGGYETAGKKLKSASGWEKCNWSVCENGTNDFGFSALPGGESGFVSEGRFGDGGGRGFWWSATETPAHHESGYAWYRSMDHILDGVGKQELSHGGQISVRCVQDESTLSAYTITFDPNGGTVNPATGMTGGVGKLVYLPTPTRDGYTFNGWHTAATGGTQITTSIVFSSDTTIFAQWNDTTGTTFTDSRDKKVYRKVTIGKQVWMAENLNYAVKGSVCYENKEDNCAKYGRLYDWSSTKQVCPSGFHLPTNNEWRTLMDYAGGHETVGKILKSASGWGSDYNGTNYYGFSALPSGKGNVYGFNFGAHFSDAGKFGYWWSVDNNNVNVGRAWQMGNTNIYTYSNYNVDVTGLSVRCVQD
jgi:uncharacterized protein (TIGR02145 family)/uncharacterized repeat protein (TIGR02543 family)